MSNRISFGPLAFRGLDNIGNKNTITYADVRNLAASSLQADINFYAMVGYEIETGTAYKLGDFTSATAIATATQNNAEDPVIITAFGKTGASAAGTLTNAINYTSPGLLKATGFGLKSFGEASGPDGLLNNGESLTFALTGGKLLRSLEFKADADPLALLQTRSQILLDVDGDVFASGAFAAGQTQPARKAALVLDVAKGAKIAIDFVNKMISVNGALRTGADVDAFFKAVANAPDKITIGSGTGAAFTVADLVMMDRGTPVDPNGKISSTTMLHNDQGIAKLADGKTVYFHGTDKAGLFIYGEQKLVDNRAKSYDLTAQDIAFLMKQAQLGVVAAADLVDPSDARGIRLLSGEGNNLANPTWAKAGGQFERLVSASYKDGVGVPEDGPNPRDISNAILNQSTSTNPNLIGPDAGNLDRKLPNNFGGNELLAAFGQYYDHGMDFLVKGGVNKDGTAAGTITGIGNAGFPNLSITRGSVAPGTGVNGVAREHINATSPFIDQNQAYGSSEAILEFLLERDANGRTTAKLLEGAGGGLPTLKELIANWNKGFEKGVVNQKFDYSWVFNFRGTGEPLLIDFNPTLVQRPDGIKDNPNDPNSPDLFDLNASLDLHFVAGDGRVNENFGLTSIHTIWAKNHNYWVQYIRDYFAKNGGFPAGLSEKHIFDMAKIVNEGEYQRAVFDEFVELMVGSDVHAFRDYNPNVNATITHEFAAAAYRLGHSMLNNYLTVQMPDGTTKELPLFAAFLNPDKFAANGGAKGIVGGMMTSLHQEIDAQMVTTMRNNLVGRPLDLAAFNIARGRDLGLPTLNEMRKMAGLSVYNTWEEFAANLRFPSDVEKYKKVYTSVNDVELWVGGLAEKPKSANGLGQDTVLGETFTYIFSVQQIALQDGDRFYYKHRLFETNLRQEIQSQDFSNIIERTLGLDYLHAEVFTTAVRKDLSGVSQKTLVLEGTGQIEVIIARDIGETIYGAGANGRGHITNVDALVNEQIQADANAVEGPAPAPAPGNKRQVDGDTIYAKGGDDVVIAGNTDDALYGGSGNDLLIGNDGDDRFDGGDGNDTSFGGAGDDDMAGNAGDDLMYGGIGDDELFGGAGNDKLYGGKGVDLMWGGDGDDLVEGGDGNDQIAGGEGNDTVVGGNGDDRLIGGGGNDTLTGGAGADTFMFLPHSGNDVITDFRVTEDKIDLHRYAWEVAFSKQVFTLDFLVFTDVAGGVKIAGRPGTTDATITLQGVTAAALEANKAKIFILQDEVVERPGLQLNADGVVIGVGSAQAELPVTMFSRLFSVGSEQTPVGNKVVDLGLDTSLTSMLKAWNNDGITLNI